MGRIRTPPNPKSIVILGVFFTSFSSILVRLSTAPPLIIAASRLGFTVLLLFLQKISNMVVFHGPVLADEIENFCGEPGLMVQHTFSLDMFVHIVPHGPDRLDYFLQHGLWTDTYTSNGKTVTAVANVIEKDQFITDNGDGTLTIVILATGNATAYGSDGKAIARDPGQLRFLIYIAADGSLTFGDVVKGSTGRSDNFCDAAITALTG